MVDYSPQGWNRVIINLMMPFQALTTVEGLSGWWAHENIRVTPEIGGTLQFRFAAGGFDMKVVELEPRGAACCGR